MTGWQNSRSTNRRHEHTTRLDSEGRQICLSCNQVVNKPITSSDDERLSFAGFMRSESGPEMLDYVPDSMPLPHMLISLHEAGPEYGYAQAPVAPYLTIVAQEHYRRHDDSIDLWTPLSELV